MIDQDWVPLSDRYGFLTHLDAWGRQAYSSRHTHGVNGSNDRGWGHCERDLRFRCACPGGRGMVNLVACCHRATAEDRLCDACRKWCYAVDNAGTYYRLIDLYGAAS